MQTECSGRQLVDLTIRNEMAQLVNWIDAYSLLQLLQVFRQVFSEEKTPLI